MIHETPLATASPYTLLSDQVAAFLTAARTAASDGITWAEFGELVVALLRLSIGTLDNLRGLTGAEKKEIALEAVAALFDTLADRAVPLVAWPLWILARPAIRSLVLSMASGAVEALLPLVRAS